MIEKPSPERATDIPTQVFSEFLKNLETAGINIELCNRLRKTLIDDNKLTERVLKEALFPQEDAS